MDDLISRQAAIDEIIAVYEWHDTVTKDRLIEHMRKLPSVHPEQVHTMDDLISREAALSCFHDWIDSRGDVHTADEIPEYDSIERLPSVQSEREKGEWIRHYCEDGNSDGWQCDQCAEWYYFGETKPNFCPNCGSDMRGEDDGGLNQQTGGD